VGAIGHLTPTVSVSLHAAFKFVCYFTKNFAASLSELGDPTSIFNKIDLVKHFVERVCGTHGREPLRVVGCAAR
jgi:hypothetical protein